jgi:serine/threonine protein kinase
MFLILYRELLCDGPTSGKSKQMAGYTVAVDMWSLGCITAMLLTGGSTFRSQLTSIPSGKGYSASDLTWLNKSSEWQKVRGRPKAFVAELLIPEDKRMTAAEALKHEWFSNEAHKTNFEELYERSIKHWRPRVVRPEIIQCSDSQIGRYLFPPGYFRQDRAYRTGNEKAIEAHYRPAPTRVNHALWPRKRSASPFESEEVREAIRNEWPAKRSEPYDFDDDDDEEGDARKRALTQKGRRQLLLPLPLATNCTPPQARRAQSAPPQPVISEYFRPKRADSPSGFASNSPVAKKTPQPNMSVPRSSPSRPAMIPIASKTNIPFENTPLSTKGNEATPNKSEAPSTIKLRRWASSPVQSSNGFTTINTPLQAKRRRNSIFDIEDDENVDDSPSQRPPKRLKKVAFTDMENSSAETTGGAGLVSRNEITLPHRPLRIESSSQDGLYLPR